MKRYIFRFCVFAILILGIMMAIRMMSSNRIIDRRPDLEKRLASVLATYGLSDENLTNSYLREKRLRGIRYICSYREYSAPRTFVFKAFEQAVNRVLGKAAYKLVISDRTLVRDKETYAASIVYDGMTVFILKINKIKRAALPSMTKTFKNPKVAIVVDDFGYTMGNIQAFFAIGQPVTLSILPGLLYSTEVAELAHKNNYEVILHLPIESHRSDVTQEADTLLVGMDGNAVRKIIGQALNSVPYADGVSNHMGSKGTENSSLMKTVLIYIKKKNLFFLDSLTSDLSACRLVAAQEHLRYGCRDMFLDNSAREEDIEEQVLKMARMAFRDGRIIALCHDRKNTVKVLGRMMPKLASDGIRFVRLSELVK